MKSVSIVFATLFFSAFTTGFAKPPTPSVSGTLTFLGKNHNSSKSVWLSMTTPGSFQLQAQGHQIVDAWHTSTDDMHLSLSPFVSQGNGGTHFLVNAENNRILDSQNQKGGIIFPPPNLPPGVMPPIVIPPGTPPIVSLPIPPIPSHPIVIPPGSPPSVTNPIPPMQSNPMVAPPGSTKAAPSMTPPQTPTKNPTIPTEKPPIATSVPGQITLYEKIKITMGQHPFITAHPILLASARSYTAQKTIASIDARATDVPANQLPVAKGATQINRDAIPQAPITEARRFDINALWNFWTDARDFDITDKRFGLDAKGNTIDITFGADRRFSPYLVFGGMLTFLQFNNTAFDDRLTNHAKGFKVGPYFGYNLPAIKNWSIDGVLDYGLLQNNNRLLTLRSAYKTQLINGTLRLLGVYQFGKFEINFKPLISLTHFRNPSYAMKGNLAGIPIGIDRESESFNFNYVELRAEGNYQTTTRNGTIVQPYIEAGLDYAFAQPNDGQILTGNLGLATISRYTGTLYLGLRTLLCKAFLINASAGYLSFGQNGLRVWEGRLLISYSFS